ncbi:cilia- and flagella-associated protein 161-like [Eriocheir sinensis]|uniref:cilia- and flagella-associated protein 161-like n=1 Tax=Eriocheir sinensis TaxID=95602 RepID=UPI0021C89428|nr:cilia- and flagella-associated protein 161-like [Eriocheir sinensis]
MARNAYHSGVRVGNWYERRLMEEEQRKTHEMRKRAERNFWELHAALLEEGTVSVCPDGLLHFGDSVLIHAPVVQPRKAGESKPSLPCTLAATPSRDALLRNDFEETPITASPDHHQPVLKNVFTIRPRRAQDAIGNVLCYGDPFDLTHVTHGGQEYHVTSPVGSALHSGRESRRQEVLLKAGSGAHSAWRLIPSDKAQRVVMEGEPAEVGARVWVVQTMTNQPMVVEEEFTAATIYGQEQQVSVGVVNRATTRAASTLALLTWTRRLPTPGRREEEKEKEVEVEVQEEKEVVERRVREVQRKLEEEEEERRVRERKEREEDAVESLRLALHDINNDSSPDDFLGQ